MSHVFVTYFPQGHMWNLRNNHVPCHCMFSPHDACRLTLCRMSNLRNAYVGLWSQGLHTSASISTNHFKLNMLHSIEMGMRIPSNEVFFQLTFIHLPSFIHRGPDMHRDLNPVFPYHAYCSTCNPHTCIQSLGSPC